MNPNHPTVVRKSARDAVAQFRGLAADPGTNPVTAAKVLLDSAAEGTRIVPALLEALRGGDPLARISAALQLNLISQASAFAVSAEMLEATTKVYLDGLNDPNHDIRILTCGIMSNGPVPDAAVPVLQRLRSDPDESMKVFVAAALSRSKEFDAQLLGILRKALGFSDPALVRTAAMSLGRLGVASAEAVSALVAGFKDATLAMKHSILLGLNELGSVAFDAADAVAAILLDRSVTRDVRAIAALTLGSITRGTEAGHAAFEEALRTNQTELKSAVLHAIAACGAQSRNLIMKATQLLSDDAPIIRMWAATVLIQPHPYGSDVLPVLIDRLGVESDPQIVSFVTDAIAALGDSAFPKLLEMTSQCTRAQLEGIIVSLAKVGTDAVRAIIAALALKHTDQLGLSLVAVMDRMEDDKSEAVSEVARMLAAITDEEVALALTVAIAHSGSASVQAVEALVKWLVCGSDELATWAARALINAGPLVLADLSCAAVSCPPDRRERILAVQECIVPHAPAIAPFAKWRDFKNDLAVRTFVYAGRSLQGNKSMSMNEIVSELTKMRDRGEIEPGFACSIRTVEMRLAQFEQEFHVPLRDCVPGRKGPLSEAAAAILPELEGYLRSLSAAGSA